MAERVNKIGLRELRPYLADKVEFTHKDIGTGAYGSVEEARIPGATVAAKKLHSQLIRYGSPQQIDKWMRDFVTECKLMSGLRHPNIVQFLGVCYFPDSELPVLLMEKLQTSLDSLLEETPDIPIEMKVHILVGTASGLVCLHSQSPPIAHRDLTARNILIDSNFNAKISDLGVSRMVTNQPGKRAATMTGGPGNILYMPPEAQPNQANTRYNVSIDIFSFGVTSLFTLTQVFPNILKPHSYSDPSGKGLIARTEIERREEYIIPMKATLGEDNPLVKLTLDCLEHFPENRPSAEEVLRRLKTVLPKDQSKLELVRIIAAKNTEIQQKKERITQLEVSTEQLQTSNEQLLRFNRDFQTSNERLQATVTEKQALITTLESTKDEKSEQVRRLEELKTFQQENLERQRLEINKLNTRINLLEQQNAKPGLNCGRAKSLLQTSPEGGVEREDTLTSPGAQPGKGSESPSPKLEERGDTLNLPVPPGAAEPVHTKESLGQWLSSFPKRMMRRGLSTTPVKDWLYWQNLPLDEKRKQYKCGNYYVTLDQIPSLHNLEHPGCADDQTPSSKVSLWRGDITRLEIDAIVNGANSSLLGGGGVDGAIHRAASHSLYEECLELNGCKTGEAKFTGGHRLPARYIVHTVGPVNRDRRALTSCYNSCLKIVAERDMRSIAFCCIATGDHVDGYPNEEAAHVALSTVKNFLTQDDNSKLVDRIIFCVFLERDYKIYSKLLPQYFLLNRQTVELDSDDMELGSPGDTPSPDLHREINPADDQ